MQNAALHALGLNDWTYQRLPVPPELFDETVTNLPGSGFAGANVTIPHKEAIWALKEAGAEVTVWNRTAERAVALGEELGVWPWTADQPTDTLVNCTAVGLDSEGDDPFANLPITPELLRAASLVVDLAYGDGETRLVAAARDAGTETVDGREILVRQGALSLERWTGREAPLDVMRDAVREL
jgi:shikimate dehydrogenase